MHKKHFQLNHNNNILSTDEVSIVDLKLLSLEEILAKYSEKLMLLLHVVEQPFC